MIIFWLSLLMAIAPALSDPVSNYYTAAVYEHRRLGNVTADSPAQIIRMNLDMYTRAVEVAKSKGADIIVFPEYGIFPPNSREGLKKYLETVPDPADGEHNPCVQAHEYANRTILYTLSCMARKQNMVVVANTGDIQRCSQTDPKCPEDGVFHFNTNVAFDRDGKLISRYHKVHLFYERGMNVAQQPQNPTFSTDFGTFAMFICFDIIFNISADAAQNSSIDNVLLPTMWIDPMPLMSAVQFWQAWALGNNVTFLASNIQLPAYAAVGSGVFSGHMGALKYTYNPDGLSKLIVSRAPKSKHQVAPFPNPDSSITVITSNGTESYEEDGKDVPDLCSSQVLGEPEDDYHDYRCLQENTVNYTFVKLTKKADFLETCNNGMCCSLNYSAHSMEEDFYFGVYNGTYNFFRYFYCQENCLVVRCDPFDDNPCQTFHLRSTTVFNHLDLRANFTTKFVYPTVAKSGMRLAPISEWSHGIQGEGPYEGSLNFASSSVDPLVVAGLNGRCYDRDPPYKR